MVQRLATCASCRINLEQAWRSSPRDPNVWPADYYVETGRDLWVMGGFAEQTLTRYTLRGRQSELFDRAGDGPGEFAGQIRGAALDSSGDTLVIIQVQRVDYFSARDLTYYRGFVPTLPVGFGIVTLPDGSVVFPSPGTSNPAAAAYALHRFAAAGSYLGSSLPLAPESRPALMPLARGAEPSTVWVLLPKPRGFTAEQWDMGKGTRARQLEVEADWWYQNPYSQMELEAMSAAGRVRSDALKPSTGAIAAYDDGAHLWITIRHPDESWRQAMGGGVPVANKLFDSFLLALDRETGQVLAGHEFDDFAIGFTNRGKLVVIGVNAGGFSYIQLYECELAGGRGER